MAPRWSNPSGGIGVHRFHVWPAGSDSYSHADLTAAWDMLDNILGQPSDATQWPATLGLDAGIYKLIRLLELEREPVGSVKYQYRPSLSIPIWPGWAVLDGSTIAHADHDFAVGGSIVLPNALNRVILGADPLTALGTAAAVVSSGNIDLPAGAPGGNATGGSNKTVVSVAQLPPHDHGGVTGDNGFDNQQVEVYDGQGQAVNVLLGSITSTEQGVHHHVVTSQGSGDPIDNRQAYIGLVPVVKVKYQTTI